VIALASQVSVPLPFSPVPITGQTLAVLLAGALLGSRRGTLCLLLYLAEGAVGLPVFAGGRAGLGHLVGPTGGYLFGFVASAFLIGRLADRGWCRRAPTTVAAMILGNAVTYAFGLPWLAGVVGAERALALGLLPFIPGDLLKVLLAGGLLPSGWRLVGRAAGGRIGGENRASEA
jgi:biotin transport system substrate-specific component